MLGALRASSGGNSAPIVNTSQAITAASTIAITTSVANQICPVTSTAAITLTSNPQLATGIAGQRVTIQNAGGFTITLTDGNGLSLQGTLAIGSTQFATFVNLGGFWQLEQTNGSPVWASFTFQNSWTNVSGHQNCEFTRFLNRVFLRGYATRSVAYSAPVVVATLPVGFRPLNLLRFANEGFAAANAQMVFDIANTGVITFSANTTPPTQFALFNSVSF